VITYVVLFTLHAIVWLTIFVALSLLIGSLIGLISPGESDNEFGPSLTGGLIAWTSLLAFWLSFKSTSYSAGSNHGFFESMKLAFVEVKFYFSGFLPWKK